MTSKEERLWGDGFAKACEIAEVKGVDALLAERRVRGIAGMTCRLTSMEIDRSIGLLESTIFQTLEISFVSVLHDEFGFGKQRVARFLNGISKFSDYMAHGWIYWIEAVDEIRKRLEIEMGITDGKIVLDTYQRPENEDLYSEKEFIDKELWDGRIKALGLMDTGSEVRSKNGVWHWEYKNEYDKVQIYDELGGVALAVEFLGAKKPGTEQEGE